MPKINWLTVIKWVAVVALPLGLVLWLLPKVFRLFKIDPTSWFKTNTELAIEAEEEQQRLQLLEQVRKKADKRIDFEALADDVENSLSGWGYNWERLNELIRGKRLSAYDLDMLHLTFGKRLRVTSWGKLTLQQWLKAELSTTHYQTMKVYWSKSSTGKNF